MYIINSSSVVYTKTIIIIHHGVGASGGYLNIHHCSPPPLCVIDHFTIVCLVAWPLNENEAGGALVLTEASLLFLCKFVLISIRTALHKKSRKVLRPGN